jgi:hypothetical protein
MRSYFFGIILPLSCTALIADEAPPKTEPIGMPPPESSCCTTLCNDHRIQVGGTYSYVHIKPHGNTSTHGNLGGIQAIYEYRPINQFYGAFEFTWREGDTHGQHVKRSLLEFDVQERLGYTVSCNDERFRGSLFTGFGYRHFGETVKVSGASSIDFNYNEFYIPVGFLLDGRFNSCFSLGLNFEWMPQVFPTVTIVPLDGARWKLENRLNNFLVELPITLTLSEDYNLSLLIVPFFESWHDGRTTAKTATGTTLNVPGNAYLFGGVNVNLAFTF